MRFLSSPRPPQAREPPWNFFEQVNSAWILICELKYKFFFGHISLVLTIFIIHIRAGIFDLFHLLNFFLPLAGFTGL